jgi:hypothetical protein
MLRTGTDLDMSRALEALVQLGPVGETVRNAMFALGEMGVRELMAGGDVDPSPRRGCADVWERRLWESIRERRAAVLSVKDLFVAAPDEDLRTSRAVAQWVAEAFILHPVETKAAHRPVDAVSLQQFALKSKPYLSADLWMRVLGLYMGCGCDRRLWCESLETSVKLDTLTELVLAEPHSHHARLTKCLGKKVADATYRAWDPAHFLAVLLHWPEGVFHLSSGLVRTIDRTGTKWASIQSVKTAKQESVADQAFDLAARACVYPALVDAGTWGHGLPLAGNFDGSVLLHESGVWRQFVHGLFRLALPRYEAPQATAGGKTASTVKGPQARQLAVWGPQALLAASTLDARAAPYHGPAVENTQERVQFVLARVAEHPYLYQSVEWQVALVALVGSLAPSWWGDMVKRGSGLVPPLDAVGGLGVLCGLIHQWVGGLVAAHQVWAAQVAVVPPPGVVKAPSPLTPGHLATLMTALNKFLHWWCREDLVKAGEVCTELRKPLLAPDSPCFRLVGVALQQGVTDLRVAHGALATAWKLKIVADDEDVATALHAAAKPTAVAAAKALVAMDVPKPGLQGLPFVTLSQVVGVVKFLDVPGPDFPDVAPLLGVAVRCCLRSAGRDRREGRRTWVGRAFEPSYESRLREGLAHARFGRRPTPAEAFLQMLLEPDAAWRESGMWQWLDRHDSFPDGVPDGADLFMCTMINLNCATSAELQTMMQTRGMLDDLSDWVVDEHGSFRGPHSSHDLEELVTHPRALRWSTTRSAWCTAVARAIMVRSRILQVRGQVRAHQRRRVGDHA